MNREVKDSLDALLKATAALQAARLGSEVPHYAGWACGREPSVDQSPLRGSLPTVEVLSAIASYLTKAEGLPVDTCLLMALVILGVEHREDADVFVRAAKRLGGDA